MARGGEIALGVAGGLGLVLVASALSKPSRKTTTKKKKPAKPWTSGVTQEIRDLASVLEENLGWIGFGDFLVAKAWTESRGYATAGSSKKSNEARGWFGMRPKSAFVGELKHLATQYPNLLKNKRWAVATAAWYAKRLRPFAADGQVIDWIALARGWAYPSRVSDIDETYERSRDTRRRFETAVEKAGLNPDVFFYERAFPQGWSWPGIDVVLDMLDARAPTGADAGVAGRWGMGVVPRAAAHRERMAA